ncbi:MAG: P13 family porin [Pseudomonadota bacterium]
MKKMILIFILIFCFNNFPLIAQDELEVSDEELDSLFADEEKAPEKKTDKKEVKNDRDENMSGWDTTEDEKTAVEFESPSSGEPLKLSQGLAGRKKSYVAAIVLSLLPGFGAGSFYAKDIPNGFLCFMLEFLGVAVLGGGIAAYYADPDADTADSVFSPSEGMMYGGIAVFGVTKIYDLVSTILAINNYNKQFAFRYGKNEYQFKPSFVIAASNEAFLGIQLDF